VKKRKRRKMNMLVHQVLLTLMFAMLLCCNDALGRPRIEDWTHESLHLDWTAVGQEYGVVVVQTPQYGWALVATRFFQAHERICPYSDKILASETDLNQRSDYKLKLRDGRFCDGNLIGKFANDYPSEDDFINAQWKVHSDNVVWLHVGACTRIVSGDLIFVRFGYEFWKNKVEVLDDPACRVAISEEIAWIDRKKNINH
jgi:hypothetical protein